MTRTTSLLAAAASLLLLSGALAACATPEDGTGAGAPAPSASADDDLATEEAGIEAAWLGGGTMVAILTRGSSTCVPTASDVEYESGVLRVAIADPPADQICTRDYVLRGFPVALPDGIDSADDLEIEVSSSAETATVELAGVAGLVPADGLEDGVPSAGWTGAEGVFAVLTWGSSGCPPVTQDAAVTAAGEITLTFAEPPADRVCTSDFSPRVTVAEVADAQPGESYELVLQGDSFSATRIPLSGVN